MILIFLSQHSPPNNISLFSLPRHAQCIILYYTILLVYVYMITYLTYIHLRSLFRRQGGTGHQYPTYKTNTSIEVNHTTVEYFLLWIYFSLDASKP